MIANDFLRELDKAADREAKARLDACGGFCNRLDAYGGAGFIEKVERKLDLDCNACFCAGATRHLRGDEFGKSGVDFGQGGDTDLKVVAAFDGCAGGELRVDFAFGVTPVGCRRC